MEHIFQPTNNFDFSNISLAQPTSVHGGAYFTKINMCEKPLYIETPKSLTKQGFTKNGKKMYCELMFCSIDDEFIQWIENLENKCQDLIFNKSESWFENDLNLNDIKSAFASSMRIYKAGKYYLIKVNVKTNYSTNNPLVKIYNETESSLTIDDVNEHTNIISIIEICGIRFTNKSFQIEMDLKQVMILNEEQLFENCLIKKNKNVKTDIIFTNNSNLEECVEEYVEECVDETLVQNVEHKDKDKDKDKDKERLDLEALSDIILNDTNVQNVKHVQNDITETLSNNEMIELDIEDLLDDSDQTSLREVNINLNLEKSESITLKKPSQVYYELYKAARKKAKESKKQTVIAFLEAKNIKKLYMLDEIDSDTDSDI
jgi:hypothetical protein